MNTAKPSPWTIVVLVLMSTLTGMMIGGCQPSNDYVAPPPPTVTVSQPVQRDVTDYLEFTGNTQAVKTVEIRARVKGFLQSVHFEAGTNVKKGDLLYVIDPRLFQAQVNKAQAELSRKQAELELAQANYKRVETLYQQQAAPEVDFVQAKANRDMGQADVAAAQASVEEVKLDLSFTQIRAPISGRVGRNLVSEGNLVGSNENTHLTTLIQYDPIRVFFSLNERDLLYFMQQDREQQGEGKQKQNGGGVIHLGLANEAGYPHTGQIDFADLGVDPNTGTFLLRGRFANPAPHPILPGMFVRLRAPIAARDAALLVTERALGTDQSGHYVLVVNEKNVVEYRPIKVGALIDRMRVIDEGLQPGDWVVVNGLLRARPGATVTPKRQEMTPPAPAAARAETSATHASATIANIIQSGRLTVAVQMNFKPFSFMSTTGQREGFDIDVMREFARRWLDDPDAVTFVPVLTAQRIPTLLDGKADIIAATLTRTPARQQDIAFSLTYFQDGQRLLVPTGSSVSGVCDLHDKPIAVVKGSTAISNLQRTAAARGCSAKLVLFDDHDSAIEAVIQGEADAFSTDSQALEHLAADKPVTIVGNHFSDEPYGLGLPKGDTRFEHLVNATLRAMSDEGTMAAIYAKWFGDRIRPYPLPPDSDRPSDPELTRLITTNTPPIFQAVSQSGAPSEYTVQPGDTLSIIAGKFYGDVSPASWKRLYAANKERVGADPSALRIGMRLTIPTL
ncbi:MAG: efflux RND transporter periplasmic adaptor subunit [Candidatus Tectomicrobia bacterium]